MKRAIMYIVTGIVAITIGGGLTYLRLDIPELKTPDRKIQEEESDELAVNIEDDIKLRKTGIKDTEIEQVYDITINGNAKILEIIFLLEDKKDSFEIIGKINDTTVFYHYENKSNQNIEAVFNTRFISEKFNENNFQFIKGLDNKNYLTIYNYENNGSPRNYYVYNQDLALINESIDINIMNKKETIMLEGGADIWYVDTKNICPNESCQIKSKIVNNKIYCLIPKINEEYSILEEYIYMADHDKIISELISTYKIINYEN